MIEEMRRATVVCLAADRAATVDALAGLGLLHVIEVSPPQSEELDRLTARRGLVVHMRGILAGRKVPSAPAANEAAPADADTLIDEAAAAHAAVQDATEELAAWRRARLQLEPWGSFSRALLERLRASGLQIRLCSHSGRRLPAPPEGAVLHPVGRVGKRRFFALVAPADVHVPDAFADVHLPEETQLAAIDAHIADREAAIARAQARLDALAPSHNRLKSSLADLDADIGTTRARDGMTATGSLLYLEGYVPARRLPELQAAARRHGWAVLSQDVAADDPRVPVLLRVPRLFRPAKAIFSLVGILPAYSEWDVSAIMLVYLSVFFGIIIGDAGYGALLLGAGLWLRRRTRQPEHALAVRLLILLSLVTIAWGVLTGTVFALPSDVLPGWLAGWSFFTDESVKNQHLQWICFMLAVTHLSAAHAWQALLNRRRPAALAHIGWGMLIWANYFAAVSLMVGRGPFPRYGYVLYGLGLVLVFGFGVNWRNMADVFNLPFSIIGSFVDLLSYIRLFAVGLAGYYIADCFNDMGRMVFDVSPWLLPAAIIVIVFGHGLNIALGFMSVLVHGVRLNTLEFSNHMGLTWSGQPFNPLRNRKER
ncbi:MAG: V-type ATP synthase subunit I [Lentisphaerae bacterium ADurb.BinA184]|nr:MAG: V-type ATP synthase subunit I [Lentisphaerae bacterium ADurb.BinA184]